MKKIFILGTLLLILKLSFCQQYTIQQQKRHLKAILDFGQSNCQGAASTCTNSTYLNSQNCIIWKTSTITGATGGSLQFFNYGVNNDYNSSYLLNTGPQISEGYRYNELTNDTLLIIKYGYAGSALVDNGSSYVNGYWQIDANQTRANNLLHYKISLDYFIIPTIKECISKNIDLEIIALCWMQGETDSGDSIRAFRYENEFKRLFDAYSDTLEYYGVKSPNFKPLISRIHNNFSPVRPYSTKVRTAQENAAAFYSAPFINTDGYDLMPDFTHYTFIGQIQHGIDRANILYTW